MRKLVIAAVAAVLLAGGAAGGWWGYHRFFRDPLEVAQDLLAKGHYQAAALELREAVQRNPGNAVAQVRLATVQLLLGDPVAAERELRLARTDGYKGSDLTPKLAEALLLQKRYRELLAELSPDALPPADAADLWIVRGLAELSLGEIGATRAAAEAAERLAPTSARAVLLAARAAVAERQPGWALALLDRALALDPNYSEALLLKAGILRAEGRPAEALPVLDEAVKLARAPLDVVAAYLSRAGALLAAGEDKKAQADLAAVLKRAPKSPAGNYLLLLTQVRAQDWRNADATLTVIQPLLSRLPRGEYYQALVKTNLGQLEQANEAIGHYTARAPRDPDGWRLLARIDLAAGRKAEAESALARVGGVPASGEEEAVVADRAETPREFTLLASQRIGSGNLTEASRDLDRSLATMPSPSDVAAKAVVAALREGELDRAEAALATLARQPRTSPERLAALTGAVRLAQLNLEGARAAFSDRLKTVPGSVPLKLDLARVLVLKGQAVEAEALLAPVLAAAPANRAVLSTMLGIYAAANQPDRARAAVAAARAAQPHDNGLLMLDASLIERGGDPGAALALLDAAASSDSTRTPPLLEMRVRLLLELKRTKEAIETARALLQEAPNDQRARRQLIDLLMADKQWQEAIELARQGLQAVPGSRSMQDAYVGATLRMSGIDTAFRLAETLRKDPANLPASLLLKGGIYMASGRPADAAAAFAAERAATPTGALMVAEAQALRAAGKTDEARKDLAAWVARQPDPAASDVLAALEIESHDWTAAVPALKAVLASRPDDAVALNNLAWVYFQLHDPKAEVLAHRAYLLLPNGQTADTLGWILTRGGKPGIGLLLLRQAVAQLPRDPSVRYHAAVALEALGQTDAAVQLLNTLVSDKLKFDEKSAAEGLLKRISATSKN